jgi:FkbM family methyltransferase
MPAVIDFESKVQVLYEHILRPGASCIDVGANEGRHLFPMARRVSPGGIVYAFEAIPALAQALRAEIPRRARGADVRIHEVAAAEVDGEAEFVVALDAPGYSGLRERTYDIPTRLEKIQVRTARLDTVLRHIEALRFVKIDVEGGEWGVIRGATALIDRFHPVVAFEFGLNSYQKYDVDPAEVFGFFATRDYVVADINGRRLGEREFVDSSRLQSVWDYAAFPRTMSEQMAGAFG